MTIRDRQCKTCGETKPTSEFYRHRHYKEGLYYSCKPCVDYKNKIWRENNPEKYKKSLYKSTNNWRKTNKDATKAHHYITNHVYLGNIKRPDNCCKCGTVAKIEAHHEDYAKPTEVLWLCKGCHVEVHNAKKYA